MKINKIYIISGILIVTSLVGGFFLGTKYQEGKLRSNFAGRIMQGQFRNRMNGTAPVFGEIISSDDKAVTVKLADGSSKIVILSDSTAISKTDTGVKSDLKSGTKVVVFGQTNSDGSVTAQTIQLNPAFRFGTGM